MATANPIHAPVGKHEQDLFKSRGACPKCQQMRQLHKCVTGNGLIYARCEACDLEGPGDTNLAIVLGWHMEPATTWIQPR